MNNLKDEPLEKPENTRNQDPILHKSDSLDAYQKAQIIKEEEYKTNQAKLKQKDFYTKLHNYACEFLGIHEESEIDSPSPITAANM